MRRVSRVLVLPLALGVVLALSACGSAPWVTRGSASASPTATQTPQVRAHGDLASGSLKRTLTAGGVKLAVTYWSTLKPKAWTASVDKPLFVSFSATAGSNVYASSVVMTAVAYRGDTQLSTKPITITDAATVQPGYLVTSPYSYTGLFTVPELPAKATSVRVEFTYVLLQVAEPSGGYAKSTTTDTLTLGLVS